MRTMEEIIKFLEIEIEWRKKAYDDLTNEYFNGDLTVEEENVIYREALMRHSECELITKILNFIKGDETK